MTLSIQLDTDSYVESELTSTVVPIIPPLKSRIAGFIEAASRRDVNVRFWLMEMLGNPDLNDNQETAFSDLVRTVESTLSKRKARRGTALEELLVLGSLLSKFLELIVIEKLEGMFPGNDTQCAANEGIAFKVAARHIAEHALFAESGEEMQDVFDTQLRGLKDMVTRVRKRVAQERRGASISPDAAELAGDRVVVRDLIAEALKD